MDAARETLEARIALLLGWERRKRRDATIVTALFYAFIAALAVPLVLPLSSAWAWAAPAVIFAALAPYLMFTRRWRDHDTMRALAALDKALNLDERATTAWELLRRNDTKPTALLVLREAAEKLERFDPRTLFPRSWGWRAWVLLPLAALWFALLQFDTRFDIHGGTPRQAPALARELHELAREMQKKAHSEGLPRTLEAGRELERIAKRSLDAGTADEALRTELAAAARKMASERSGSGQAAPDLPAGARELADLRSELEAARESFAPGDGEAQGWQEKLAGSSQLKKQLDARQGDGRELSRGELKALVDKLEREAAAEADRRALAQAEESLKALTQRGQAQQGDPRARPGGNPERDALAERPRDNTPGNMPGDAPGEKGGAPSLPQFRGEKPGGVKSDIGEGERSVTFFKAKPAPGKSRLTQDEVIAAYRQQAEAELNTERLPEDLRDTIRSYFLSLDKEK